MSGLFNTAVALSMLLLIPASAFADIYKYRDESGRLIFVDDKDKIPARYHEETHSIAETENSLGVYNSPRNENPASISTIEEDIFTGYQRKDKETYRTPVIIEGNRVIVPVEVALGNRSTALNLLLDTGATSTVFHRSALTSLDLPKGRTYEALVAGGGIVKSIKIKFKSLTVGPFHVQDKQAMVINLRGRSLPYDGMLGMDFLMSHPYQVNYEEQFIEWQKP